jgi:MYXO-CTERM domain-containing protein
MLRRVIAGMFLVGAAAASAPAAFMGTVDFEDGTVGEMSKVLNVSNPQNFEINDYGGPGNLEFRHHGVGTGNFKSSYRLFDTSAGAGDIYGDVALSALYKPSNEFEIVLAGRVQANGSSMGLQASNGLGGIRIGYQNTVGGTSGKGTTDTTWDDLTTISMDPNKWYAIALSIIGSTVTGSVQELDVNFLPVAGKSTTVSYTDTLAELASTGFAGTRGAQTNNAFGYVLDNVTVVPEPSGLTLLGLGGLGLMRRRRTA